MKKEHFFIKVNIWKKTSPLCRLDSKCQRPLLISIAWSQQNPPKTSFGSISLDTNKSFIHFPLSSVRI